MRPLKDKHLRPRLVEEMATRIHEVPVAVFFQRFVHSNSKAPTAAQRKKFHQYDYKEKSVGREPDLYPELARVVASVLKEAGSQDLKFLDTASYKAREGGSSATETYNDAGIYVLSTEEARKATELTGEDRDRIKMKKNDLVERSVGRCSWRHIGVPIEIKNDSSPAFHFGTSEKSSKRPKCKTKANNGGKEDNEAESSATANSSNLISQLVPKFVCDSAAGQEAFGQLLEYVLNVFKHQHRTSVLSIYIYKNMCRLLYHDHSGSFVSTPFNWTRRDSALHDFVWSVAHMELSEMGYDPSATLASNEEIKAFKVAAESESTPEIRRYVEEAMTGILFKLRVVTKPPSSEEMFPDDPKSQLKPGESMSDKMSVDDPKVHSEAEPVEEVHEFIVGNPRFVADSLIGRCTQGYVAYHLGMKKFCFLKDCWRTVVPNRTRPEHVVYARLHEHKVPNIMTIICGADVRDTDSSPPQRTKAQDDLVLGGKRPAPRVHYRLATEQIGVPLRDFRHFKELTFVFAYALETHMDAWEKAKLLHRDISVGNIMIDPSTRCGYLIDWDLARLAGELPLKNGTVGPDRSGTWQYRSALALKFPRKPYKLSDDLESFVHAFRYLVLQYQETDENLDVVKYVYDSYKMVGNVTIGGESKLKQLLTSTPPFNATNSALQVILNKLAAGCYESYRSVDLARMQEMYGISAPLPDIQDQTHDDESHLKTSFIARFGQYDTVKSVKEEVMKSSLPKPSTCSKDPCILDGFLSDHSGLMGCFIIYQEIPSAMLKKGVDFFELSHTTTRREFSRSGTRTADMDYWEPFPSSFSECEPAQASSSNYPDAPKGSIRTGVRGAQKRGRDDVSEDQLEEEPGPSSRAARSSSVKKKEVEILSQSPTNNRKRVKVKKNSDDEDKSGTYSGQSPSVEKKAPNSSASRGVNQARGKPRAA